PVARRGSVRELGERERVLLAQVGGDDADRAVLAGREGQVSPPFQGHREDEAVVVVGVLADEVHAARAPGEVLRPAPEDVFEGGHGAVARVRHRRLRWWTAGSAASLAAACSGVMSRCGSASISKPTMNLRTVADRRSGG